MWVDLASVGIRSGTRDDSSACAGCGGGGRAEPEAPTFHIPGKGEAKKEQRRGRRGSWRPRPRWERIPRDTDRRLDGAAVARGVTATSAGGGWVAGLWADGETGPELHVQEWREARRQEKQQHFPFWGERPIGKGRISRASSLLRWVGRDPVLQWRGAPC